MKLFILTIFYLLFAICYLPARVNAHLPGQEPYFKINNKFTTLYPVLLIPSSGKFTLPQDIAPEKYAIDKEINFEIIKDRLPFSEETVDNSEFYWDFGDGTKTTGLISTHTFTKEGSYTVTVQIDYDKSDNKEEKELLQSTLLHIMQNPSKTLPKLEVKVNGDTFNKEKGNLKLDISKNNTFEANLIGTSDADYLWDMSDGKILPGSKITYKNTSNFLILNPVVRATTKDGFIFDAEVIIENNKKSPDKKSSIFLPLALINGAALIVFAGYLFFSKKKS